MSRSTWVLQREEDSLLVIGSDRVCPILIKYWPQYLKRIFRISAAALIGVSALSEYLNLRYNSYLDRETVTQSSLAQFILL